AACLPGVRGAAPPAAGPRLDTHGDPLPAGAIARLGTVRFRHAKGIAALALSPDGKTITSVGGDGSIVLHSAATGAKLRSFAGEASYCSVAIAPDGKTVAVAVDRRVWVRELATGKQVRQFEVAQGPVHRLALSSDGRTLVAGGQRLVQVW